MNYNQSYSGGNDNENISLSDRSGRLSANVNGQGLLNPGSDRAVGFSATGRTDVAIFSGSSRYFMSADGQSSELSGSLGLSTTLAFADGYIAATGSPSPALAILVPSSDLRGQRVDLHPMSGGGGATSPSGWAAIVNGLTPYTDYVAGVELPQSPPDTRPNLSSIEFMPQYRSIAVIRVGLAPSIAIRATLVDDEKAPVANMPGDLVGAKGALVPGSGTFTDEKGVFECYGLAPGMMSMRWADGSILTFTVPASRPGSIIDLGIVTAQVSSPGGQQ